MDLHNFTDNLFYKPMYIRLTYLCTSLIIETLYLCYLIRQRFLRKVKYQERSLYIYSFLKSVFTKELLYISHIVI